VVAYLSQLISVCWKDGILAALVVVSMPAQLPLSPSPICNSNQRGGGGQGWRLRWLPLSPCRAFSVNSDYVFLDSSILLGGGGRQWRPGNGSFLRPKPKLPRGRCWARLSSPFTSLEGMGHATMWFLSCCERPSAP
jgi:hypothetical protein